MKTVFENAQIIDPDREQPFLGDLLVQDGLITEIFDTAHATELSGFDRIDCHGKYLAPGIVDLGVKICEPGERHKESYASAARAAAAGGVTTIITRPDTMPVIDTPEILEFARRRAQADSAVRVLPMAALTKGRAGREMTEIGFLKDAGAVAFSDCDHVVRDNKVLNRALSYARSLGVLVMGHPQEPTLSAGAAASSGKFAALKGLPTVSPIAERMGVDRDVALLEITNARYHFDQITTARALPALARAKRNGLDITAGTSIHHLTLNELDIADYRSFFKIKPPLRSEEDRIATLDAVQNGLIDIVSSMHTPQDEESKRLPFEEAASGAVGLETFLPAMLRLYHAGALSLNVIFRVVARNPAKRLGLNQGSLCVGAPADFVLFDPNIPFVLDRFSLRSKSKNTPFDGARLQGRVLASYVAGKEVFAR